MRRVSAQWLEQDLRHRLSSWHREYSQFNQKRLEKRRFQDIMRGIGDRQVGCNISAATQQLVRNYLAVGVDTRHRGTAGMVLLMEGSIAGSRLRRIIAAWDRNTKSVALKHARCQASELSSRLMARQLATAAGHAAGAEKKMRAVVNRMLKEEILIAYSGWDANCAECKRNSMAQQRGLTLLIKLSARETNGKRRTALSTALVQWRPAMRANGSALQRLVVILRDFQRVRHRRLIQNWRSNATRAKVTLACGISVLLAGTVPVNVPWQLALWRERSSATLAHRSLAQVEIIQRNFNVTLTSFNAI